MNEKDYQKKKTMVKAKMLMNLLRIAGNEACSPTAQALLAIIIAEAWPLQYYWGARLGYPVLEHRMGVTRNTIRRASRELELANLIRFHPGKGQRISTWQLPNHHMDERASMVIRVPKSKSQGVTHAPSNGAPTPPGGVTHAPGRGHPRPLKQGAHAP